MPSKKRLSENEARDLRARQVYILRIRDQKSNEEIAQLLNIEVWQVKKDLERAYKVLKDDIIADTEEATNSHILRLRELSDKLRPKALMGDVNAAREYRACLESERKLRGLDKQKEKLEISGPGGSPVKVQSIESEIVRRYATRKALGAGKPEKPAIDTTAREVKE